MKDINLKMLNHLQQGSPLIVGLWTLTFLLVLSNLVSGQVSKSLQKAPEDTAKQLINQLKSKSYDKRVAASRKLIGQGEGNIGLLFDAILSDDFETSFRAINIVKEIGLTSDLDTLENIILRSQQLPQEKSLHFEEWSLKAIAGWKERKSQKAEEELVDRGAKVTQVEQFAELGLLLIDDFGHEIATVKKQKNADVKTVLEQIDILKREMAGEVVAENIEPDPQDKIKQRIQQLEMGGRFVLPAGGEIVSPSVNPKTNPRHVQFDSNWSGKPEDLLQLRFVENLSQVEFVETRISPEILSQLGKIRKLRSLLLTRCNFSFAELKKFKAKKDTQFPLQLLATGPGYLGVYGPNPGEPNDGSGSYVSMVSPNSAASAAGFERGDMITQVDEDQIQSFAELSLVISSKPVGKEIRISIKRKDEEKVLVAKLKSRVGLR